MSELYTDIMINNRSGCIHYGDIIRNLCKDSPFQDKNGIKFILLSSYFIAYFYNSFQCSRSQCISYVTLYNLYNKLMKMDKECCMCDVSRLLPVRLGSKNSKIMLCRPYTDEVLDMESALENITENIANNRENKYVKALITPRVVNDMGGIYIFDFEYDYEGSLKKMDELMHNAFSSNKTKDLVAPKNVRSFVVETQNEESESTSDPTPEVKEESLDELLEKLRKVMNGNDSCKVFVQLAKLANDIDSCLKKNHFNLDELRHKETLCDESL